MILQIYKKANVNHTHSNYATKTELTNHTHTGFTLMNSSYSNISQYSSGGIDFTYTSGSRNYSSGLGATQLQLNNKENNYTAQYKADGIQYFNNDGSINIKITFIESGVYINGRKILTE